MRHEENSVQPLAQAFASVAGVESSAFWKDQPEAEFSGVEPFA